MPYLTYNEANKKFYLTHKRPCNQGDYDVLVKISNRLKSFVNDNPTLELTDLQKKFVKHLKQQGEDYRRSVDKIDIAHGVAISKIMALFVKVLNEPELLKKFSFLNNLNNFFDATLSTEQPIDSEEETDEQISRASIRAFLKNIRDGQKSPEKLCQQANEIIHHLNKCSRNLVPGLSSKNRTIGAYEDPPFVLIKGRKNHAQKIEKALKISEFFKKLEPDYASKPTKTNENILYSSSVSFFRPVRGSRRTVIIHEQPTPARAGK